MDRRERQTLLNRRICGEEDGNVRPACAGGAQTQKSAAPAMNIAPIDSGRNIMYAVRHEKDMQVMR